MSRSRQQFVPATDTMSVSEAALALGVVYNRALNLLLSRRLDGFRAGHRWRVSRASVARYLAGQAPTVKIGRPRKSA